MLKLLIGLVWMRGILLSSKESDDEEEEGEGGSKAPLPSLPPSPFTKYCPLTCF